MPPLQAAQTATISIHAPAQGATFCQLRFEIFGNDFNSRSRTGSDDCSAGFGVQQKRISIHAPAQGATVVRYRCGQIANISIHAPAQGATQLLLTLTGIRILFQFTLPHRERHCISLRRNVPVYFNSRSRTGSDIVYRFGGMFLYISIHAPAQGATLYIASEECSCIFQFTLPHRERPFTADALKAQVGFQFTLPHRERPLDAVKWKRREVFQFTLPHRERPMVVSTSNLRQ